MGERGGPDLKAAASIVIELAGVIAVTAGCALLAPWLGLIVGGLLLVLVGAAINPPVRPAAAEAPREIEAAL